LAYQLNFNEALGYLLSAMKTIHEYFEAYFKNFESEPEELVSFKSIDKSSKRIDSVPIEYSEKLEAKKVWTNFWKLFLGNLKLLMLFHELKQERELIALFPVKHIET
jgi:midasin (ATPase involved in ribosome maturation)